ncbi:hypothetical protein GUJ93_ZPchr0002g25949 [Zizania palustris]|uniref:Queuine tRNA-ribosyltransferase catalytic subunit 1 n=1 Tax=Zizania palustris TaxID=103762 RepID=A0A8J5VUZ5_ZIZPA|nr:hypothetical protein GUJ93_ZPchr0002g25949 [Zizania palustris]
MPVGTQGTIKGLTTDQLEEIGCQIILGNTYHLELRPGSQLIDDLGGLHKFMNWKRALLTDSGGFQMVSLLHLADITEEGVTFQSPVDGKPMLLTPEESIHIQNKIGADIIMALDDVVKTTTTGPRMEEAMYRTLRWIDRCIAAHKKPDAQNLFGIVQGGVDPVLRDICVRGLVERNLPGYAIGGLAGGEDKDSFWRVVAQCTAGLPEDKPRYVMGVGYPLDIVVCSALGADMYDCVYPTRTARFGTALVPEGILKLKQNAMATDERPIDPTCPCMVCKNYTRAYLHCLVTKDAMGSQLLSYHNLSFMMRLSRDLHMSIIEGRFPEFVRGFLRMQFPKGDIPKWVRNAMVVAGIDISECCAPAKCPRDAMEVAGTDISEICPPTNPPPAGAKLFPLLVSLAVGLAVRFLAPRPRDVSLQSWQLLSIFLSTIAGLVLGPLPVGAWAFLGLTAVVATHTLPFAAAFSAFTNEVIWLIVISFFFARGFVKTGLGDRIATYFVKLLGNSTLGLSYGLTISEACIAPAMPSTTARAGGVFLPIIKSLSLSAKSKPNHPVVEEVGVLSCDDAIPAQNLLCLKLAEELGVIVSSPWVSWFKAASLPAIVSLLATPYVLYKIFPPEIKDTPDAPTIAADKLERMGPVTKNEWVMIGTMLLAVSLWVFGDAISVSSVVAAMLGLSILLLLGVLDWDDCLNEKAAWDTLAWFAVLVGMAGQLTNLGIVSWMSSCVAKLLESFSLSWPTAFCVLQASYFLIHYLFASQTGHVGALYSAFLAMHVAAGVPRVMSALALAFNTNLFGALTHYSSGQAAVYFGAGYLELPDVFTMGFVTALINVLIWAVVGTFWWKLLGLY